MTDSDGRSGGRGNSGRGSRSRLGTPKPEWGDNVIEADFGSRGRERRDRANRVEDAQARISATKAAMVAAGLSPTVADAAARRRDARHREQRGIGRSEGWGARTLLEAVCRQADTARNSRGREYFRSGNVRHLDIEPGEVTALVAGSQPEPFEVSMRWRLLTGNQVAYVRGECLEHADNLSRLLAGKEPRRDVAAVLFRVEDLRDSWCTCPDRSGMCKHRVAVAHAVAEKFSADPVAFLDWRGVDTLRLVDEVGEQEARRHPEVVDLQRREVRPGDRGNSAGDGQVPRPEDEVRYSPAEFWGDLSRVPQWDRLDVEQGLGLGDTDTRNAVVRKVSWNTVDQLRVLDELQSCYDLLTTGHDDIDHSFDNEPWLSDPSGRIGTHD